MQYLGNVYICGSPFVMSRTDAQNGLDMVFKHPKKITDILLVFRMRNETGHCIKHVCIKLLVPFLFIQVQNR